MKAELKKIDGLTKVLGAGDELIPLTEEEVDFLIWLGGDDQMVEMSSGIIVDSKVVVTEGPMVGMEGFIRKIDRHKRKAWLEIEMFGRKQEVQVGLEIVAKSM